MRLAIAQTAGQPGDVQANLASLAELAARAADRQARLLMLPELYLSGYNIGDRVAELAVSPDAAPLLAVRELARAHTIALLLGYPEQAPNGQVYNSACLIERDGSVMANYRKAHLYGGEEKRLFQAGDTPAIVDFDGLKVAIIICYDVEFPDYVRTLALEGTELIVVPTALMTPNDFVAERMIPTRAAENGCFVAYANRCGAENGLRYCGLSCAAGPDGRLLAQAGREPELLVVDIDKTRYSEFKANIPYLTDRRPELYRL